MTSTVRDILEFVRENDIKFVRLTFCDLFGTQKNISIMPGDLEDAFVNGVSFDANAVKGFENATKSDLFLFPDPSSLLVMPWRPQQGRVARFMCDIKNPDGSDFMGDTRSILKKILGINEACGYTCKIGAECEFYLFKTNENGEATDIPFDQGGYMDVLPLDKGENIRREICLKLEELGIMPESSHHEQGPGQNEIDFKFSDALTSADNFLMFKHVVRSTSYRNGLYASFMPKPIKNKSGSGFHINISLVQNGINIFKNIESENQGVCQSFIAGVLDRTSEITAFLNSDVTSYDRLGEFEAPKYVSWSHQNRSQLVRIPAAKGDKARMELRSPDPMVNPYIAFALIVAAGFEGIERGLALPEEVNVDLYTAPSEVTSKLSRLPQNLTEAIEMAKSSGFAKEVLGSELFDRYLNYKEKEVRASLEGLDKI